MWEINQQRERERNALGGDLGEGKAERAEAGVDIVGDSVLVVEGLVDELDGEHGRVA